jgi:2-dehydro-3-deoxygalactonokinase
MSGEECETLGALSSCFAPPTPAPVFLWPGSHTKLVATDAAGRIVRSATTLAGELAAAVARHTVLAASLPEDWPDDPDPEAVAAGSRLVARDGLGRAAFLVRIAALFESWAPAQRAAFWIGAVVADDVAHLARHPILEAPLGGEPSPVWVGGRQPQRGLYASELARRHRGPVRALDDDLAGRASALGALAVAWCRDELERSGQLMTR